PDLGDYIELPALKRLVQQSVDDLSDPARELPPPGRSEGLSHGGAPACMNWRIAVENDALSELRRLAVTEVELAVFERNPAAKPGVVGKGHDLSVPRQNPLRRTASREQSGLTQAS